MVRAAGVVLEFSTVVWLAVDTAHGFYCYVLVRTSTVVAIVVVFDGVVPNSEIIKKIAVVRVARSEIFRRTINYCELT